MGKAIVIGLVIIIVVIIVAVVLVHFRNKESKEKARERGWALKGDLNSSQEQILLSRVKSADMLFRLLLTPPTDLSGDMTILSEDHRQWIGKWLGQDSLSEKDVRKVIKR